LAIASIVINLYKAIVFTGGPDKGLTLTVSWQYT